MKKIGLAALTMIASLLVSVSCCGALAPQPTPRRTPPTSGSTPPTPTPIPPTPTPQIVEPNYTNAATGVSMWYPDGWVYEEYLEEVIFASSEKIISGAELATGAAMMIEGGELEDLTIDDLVQTTLSELSFEGIKTSDPKPRTIGGCRGILVTLEGTPEGAPFPMRGFLAGAEHKGWGHLFVAVSVRDEWSEYGPLLETMLDSVQFPAFEPVYASSALGLSIRYPEDWIYEEQGEQVIFGTSEEIISGAELETGAVMLVVGAELEERETVEDMVEMMFSEMPFEKVKTSDLKPRTIGGQRGLLVNFEGTPEGAPFPMRGFLAGVQHQGWGYLFLGISVLDEWCDHGPALETMLDSVQFTKEQQ